MKRRKVIAIGAIAGFGLLLGAGAHISTGNQETAVEQQESALKRIIAEEDIENIKEIQYYSCGGNKKYIISNKDDIQGIGHEISKIQLTEENAVPENEWFEGGKTVELVMKNGESIEFGCGPDYIAFGEQYYVDFALGQTIIEKGTCEEESR